MECNAIQDESGNHGKLRGELRKAPGDLGYAEYLYVPEAAAQDLYGLHVHTFKTGTRSTIE
jgi:hypothetical protein